jgi:outer membrane murein-binding lipoprotein Lpp
MSDEKDETLRETNKILRAMWNENKLLNQKIDRVAQEVADTRRDLGARIDGVQQEVAGVRQDLGARIDGVKHDLGARIDDVSVEVRAVRNATQSGFELLARADARRDRELAEVRERLDRVEQHVGLRPPE